MFLGVVVAAAAVVVRTQPSTPAHTRARAYCTYMRLNWPSPSHDTHFPESWTYSGLQDAHIRPACVEVDDLR